ncbi:hypothetical protein TorRG33x02_182880, partial [Trema orientale]
MSYDIYGNYCLNEDTLEKSAPRAIVTVPRGSKIAPEMAQGWSLDVAPKKKSIL